MWARDARYIGGVHVYNTGEIVKHRMCCRGWQYYLTLKVLVATIDALGHFETG